MTKPMPRACRKGELYKFLNGISTTSVRDRINIIISDSRNIPLEDAKKEKVCYKPEVEQCLVYFGELD